MDDITCHNIAHVRVCIVYNCRNCALVLFKLFKQQKHQNIVLQFVHHVHFRQQTKCIIVREDCSPLTSNDWSKNALDNVHDASKCSH